MAIPKVPHRVFLIKDGAASLDGMLDGAAPTC
jgi:hypothetical protein